MQVFLEADAHAADPYNKNIIMVIIDITEHHVNVFRFIYIYIYIVAAC